MDEAGIVVRLPAQATDSSLHQNDLSARKDSIPAELGGFLLPAVMRPKRQALHPYPTSAKYRYVGHVVRMGEEREAYRVLVGKPEGKRPLGRPRRRWVDNIRMDLQEVGCGYVDWIGLAQDRDRWRTLVSAVMNLRVP